MECATRNKHIFYFFQLKKQNNNIMIGKNATPENDWYVYLINIIIGIVLAASFLIVFFFTTATQIEQQIAEKNINVLVDNFTKGAPQFLGSQFISDKKTQIEQSLTVPPDLLADLQEQDAKVTESNQKLLTSATNALAALLGFSVMLIILLVILAKMRHKKWHIQSVWKTLVLPNIIILTAVGLTEFCFLKLIGGSFLTTDVNKVQTAALDATIAYAAS